MKRRFLIFTISILLLLALLLGSALGYTYFSKQHLYSNGLSDLWSDLKILSTTDTYVHNETDFELFSYAQRLKLYFATPLFDAMFLELRKVPLSEIGTAAISVPFMELKIPNSFDLHQAKS